jgi:hypothetical protein
MTSSFDPKALESVSEQFEKQQADAKRRREKELRRQQEWEDAAWNFADNILKLDQDAHEIQFGAILDASYYAARVVPTFWIVCEVIRKSGLRERLDVLDEKKMITFHGGARDSELATTGYQQALSLLWECTSPQFKKTKALERQLRGTFGQSAGRHMWYMMCAIVKGLLTEQGRLFIQDGIPQRLAHIPQFKGRNADRNWQWWKWHEDDMKSAEIRDRWNLEHPDQQIAKSARGRDLVKQTLRNIKRWLPQVR